MSTLFIQGITEEELKEHFQHVLKNPFMTRVVEYFRGNVPFYHISSQFFMETKTTKGDYTEVIFRNSKGVEEYAHFWKYIKDRRIQYGYSFKADTKA